MTDEFYRFSVLRGRELARLVPLFLDAFGRSVTDGWLTRKYACSANDVEGFACAAFTEAGEPAGAVGVLPWGVRYGDRVEVAGQMVDVATGNAHRGRGLFVRLAEQAREVCEFAGVGFLFGFPNEAAYPIWINKLGYEHFHDLVEFRLPVRTFWAERVARRATFLAPAYEQYVDRNLRRAATEELPNSLLAEGFAAVEHDRAFHAYKAAFGGSRVVGLDGGRVWLNVRHGLLLGDLEAATDSDAQATTRALSRLARLLGIHQILFIASKDTRFDRLLGARYKTSQGLPIIHRNIRSEIPREKLRFTFADLDNY